MLRLIKWSRIRVLLPSLIASCISFASLIYPHFGLFFNYVLYVYVASEKIIYLTMVKHTKYVIRYYLICIYFTMTQIFNILSTDFGLISLTYKLQCVSKFNNKNKSYI